MLTPQEVAEHAFSKASFGGYNMAMVDEFLDLLTADYTTLYKENATLKAKMKVLADKVEEYRSTDDAMRKALMSAQKVADQMVAEAEARKSSLLADAEREAVERQQQLRQELEEEERRLNAARSATSAYVAKLKELCQNEMEYLSSLSRLASPPRRADRVAQAADATAAAVERAVQEVQAAPRGAREAPPPPQGSYPSGAPRAAQSAPAAPRVPQPAGEEESPTRRMDFSDLKFGKDYQLD